MNVEITQEMIDEMLFRAIQKKLDDWLDHYAGVDGSCGRNEFMRKKIADAANKLVAEKVGDDVDSVIFNAEVYIQKHITKEAFKQVGMRLSEDIAEAYIEKLDSHRR